MTERHFVTGNKGVSLIELLVVIAILAVFAGGGILGVRFIASGNVQKASQAISSALSEVRTDTMSIKAQWEVRIYNDGDSNKVSIYKNGEEHDTTELGGRIDIKYDNMQSVSGILEENQELIITFKESSGIVGDIQYGRIGEGKESVMDKNASGFKITAESGSRSCGIIVWYETGKVTDDN
ncbi:MAG: Tfp pilus assembly protein FimT/FimU [Lachnospiraceae bacterium]